ncbi:hypothetical protein GQ42DRAFT_102544, partial [Ramicandelaber brevisporus]
TVEYDYIREGVEKLISSSLYSLIYGQSTTDDKARDTVLNQRIKLFRWIDEKHLDIPQASFNDGFLKIAISELYKMNTFKAPRDKLICILNCCTVIYGLLNHHSNVSKGKKSNTSEVNADQFLPALIYIIIRANPPELVSNVMYISRFRTTDLMRAESEYYLTSFMGAISFIESMDASTLSISQSEFDRNIEETLKQIDTEQKQSPS